MRFNFRRFLCCLCAGSQGGSSSVDGEDHISRLPNDVLSRIISLLPNDDGARTALLSSRWRGLWASTPLVLDNSDLLLAGNFISVRAVIDTVSRVIDAHPGPFRSVNLTCYLAEWEQSTLAGWIQALAAKGVHELVLRNIPWGEHDVLPAALFLCRSLERLHVSSWRFPDTAAGILLHRAVFPRLRDLVLCNTVIKDPGLDNMLACSPVLKTLVLVGNGVPLQIHLRSRSLRCVVFWYSAANELAVVSAPLLERMILWDLALLCCTRRRDDHRMTIKLSRASGIRVVGYLKPRCHRLLIGNTMIRAETKASPEVTVPSVKILGLAFRFGVAKESGMVPSFLRSFPNTETLHLMSLPDNGSTTTTTIEGGAGNFEHRKEFDSAECVRSSSIKKVVIHGFRWENSEIELLKCIVERGKGIMKIYIFDAADGSERDDKLSSLASLNLGGTVMILSGEDSILTHGMLSDLSRIDPFDSSAQD